MNSLDRKILGGCTIVASVIVLISSGLPFFWDNVLQGSRVAMHFYDSGFDSFILPADIDVGHPPFFGWYLALFWLIFGKSLWASHLAMLPWIVLLCFFWYKICYKLIEDPKLRIACFVIGFLEPAIFTHLFMISPETALVSLVIAGFYAIWVSHHRTQAIVFSLLVLINIRGTLWVLAFFIPAIYLHASDLKKLDVKSLSRFIYPFIISGLVALIWFGYHYVKTGFITDNANNSFAKQYYWTSAHQALSQLKFVAWRFTDQGRWIAYMIILFLLIMRGSTADVHQRTIKRMLFFVSSLSIVFVALLSTRPFTTIPRYYIPLYLCVTLITFIFLSELKREQLRHGLMGLLFLSYITGHFWVYPERIYQAWDTTLLHTSYFALETKMKKDLSSLGLSESMIATGAPLLASDKFTRLMDVHNADFLPLHEDQIEGYNYVLDCRICNGISINTKQILRKNWQLIKEWESKGLWIRLYKNRQVD